MPVTVVVGGQYGSEGKGKVSLETVRRDPTAAVVVRPGGTNSGHTGFARDGRRLVLRQIPAGAIDGEVEVVLPAGAYVDPELLAREISLVGIDPRRVRVDPRAHVVTAEHARWEECAGLASSIGSTGSGTGAAVIARAARYAPGLPRGLPAGECEALRPYLADTVALMRDALTRGRRIVVEGTQGLGLSPVHGDAWPKATSRDTTAAAFLSEAGLAPTDADDVALVLRTYPIRVAGDSGPLRDEIGWSDIAHASGGPFETGELTSVTRKLRRVGLFESEQARRAVVVNQPHRIVLNHLDQIDHEVARTGAVTPRAELFVREIERAIGRRVDELGIGEGRLIPRSKVAWNA